MSKKMVINTQERAISTDINRLQSFALRDAVEALRYRYLGAVGSSESPSTAAYPSTTGTPLYAEIIGGLMVRPQAGSFNLLIDAGCLVAIDSTNRTVGVDDSPAVFVRSAGTTVPILANASGSVRIDVVECRVSPTPTIVTDNRDIFDSTSGLFTATTVTKETEDTLEFRVRQGTPGSGYPAAQAGWLPLCVCRVPSGAANVDTCDFWDVRPLVDDWAFQSKGVGSTALSKVDLTLSRYGALDARVTGTCAGRINGRRFGGTIRGGQPGTYDAFILNVGLAATQDSGAIVEPLTAPIYMYACHPFGLPRWAYYAPSPNARVPQPPGAMIIVSSVGPTYDGTATTIALPPSTGLGGTVATGLAICMGVIYPRKSGFPGQIGDFGHMTIREGKAKLANQGISSLVSTNPSGSLYDWALTDAIWPQNVRAVDVTIVFSYSIPSGAAVGSGSASGGDPILRMINDAIATDEIIQAAWTAAPVDLHNGSGGVLNMSWTQRFRLERPTDQTTASMRLELNLAGFLSGLYGTAPTLLTNPTLSIRGYEMY